jgi:adenylate cyclase
MLHNRENLRQEIVAAEEITSGRRSDVHDVTIGFCDVVGFTRLGEGVAAADLGAIATRLAALAADAIEPPVRLVKTIGDAVMLVAPEPAQLVESTLRLVEGTAGEEGFPAIRAGIAYGQVVNRWGDWYGSTVNVASRLTTRARPASVLATEAVRDAASNGYEWSFAGDKRLKGLSSALRTYRVRRSED